jgi:hypothetical protein
VHEDLARVFGSRLLSLLAYRATNGSDAGGRRHMVVVSTLTPDDLAALVPLVPRWRAAGNSVPLLLTRHELDRSLDIFPLEYSAIAASHELVAGIDPFARMAIASADLRRACERQVKGHLIHLREGLLETGGRPSAVAALVQSSAAPFRAVLRAVARLHGKETTDDAALAAFAEETLGLPGRVVRDVLGADSGRPVDAPSLMPDYLALTGQLWTIVDTWRG